MKPLAVRVFCSSHDTLMEVVDKVVADTVSPSVMNQELMVMKLKNKDEEKITIKFPLCC